MFNILDLGRLKKHHGVWYESKSDKNGEIYILASMKKFEDEIGKNVNEKAQKESRRTSKYDGISFLVGKVLYLMAKLAPDLADPA